MNEVKKGEKKAGNFLSAKETAAVGLMVALLIGGQYALSAVAGVEIVTVLLLSFSVAFGRKCGMLAATAFSLLRGVVFGFAPSVLLLYLIYYNLFALFFGSLKNLRGLNGAAAVTLFAILFTACFTLLDDVIYPLYAGLSGRTWKMYFLFSLPVMATQCVCAAVSVGLLYYPLLKIFSYMSGARAGAKALSPDGKGRALHRESGRAKNENRQNDSPQGICR